MEEFVKGDWLDWLEWDVKWEESRSVGRSLVARAVEWV